MFGRHLPLPAPRTLPWPLKVLESACTSLSYDDHGRMVMRIRHDILKGVTPEQVAWWFGNIGGDMDIGGSRVNKYLVWHPLDHVLWQLIQPGPDGGASVGAKFRIVEVFGRNPAFSIDVIDTVVKLDATGITLVGNKLGVQLSHLNHDFVRAEGGTRYDSALTIGTDLPVLRSMLNPLIHRTVFTEEMGRGWLRHNIEEVGLLEHILPHLARANGGP